MENVRPKASIIIPVRNHREFLRRLLESLRLHLPSDVPLEIVVVDDGSSADLTPLIEEFGARCLRNERSEGPAAARNRGASLSRGELLLFLDADVEYAPGALEIALEVFEARPETGGLSFMNQPYDPRDGAVKNFGAALEHYWFRELFKGSASALVAAPGLATRNGVVSREAFESVGGFDTSFRTNAHEDYDFGKRLAARAPVFLAAAPVLYHNYPDSLRRMLRNLWVRVTLFMPYYLQHRPQLDKVQTSSHEAALRLVGAGALGCLALSALPVSGFRLWLLPGLGGLALYTWVLKGFLQAAGRWSGSAVFVLQAFLLHLLTSVVIAAGSGWGALRYLLRPTAPPLKSPIR